MSKELMSGKIYAYNIRVKATGIEVSEVTSSGTWTDDGSVDIPSTDNTQQ